MTEFSIHQSTPRPHHSEIPTQVSFTITMTPYNTLHGAAESHAIDSHVDNDLSSGAKQCTPDWQCKNHWWAHCHGWVKEQHDPCDLCRVIDPCRSCFGNLIFPSEWVIIALRRRNIIRMWILGRLLQSVGSYYAAT